MAQFNETIDYSKKASFHSSYRWSKLTPIGISSGTVTLNTSSSTIINFEIPNNAVNLSQSKLNFNLTLPSGGATVHTLDALAGSLFDRVQLSTRSGVVLAQVENMGQFAHIISKVKTKFTELIDNPAGSYTDGVYPNAVPVPITNVIAGARPYGSIMKNNSIPYEAFGRAIQTSIGALSLSGAIPVNASFFRIVLMVLTYLLLFMNLYLLSRKM